MENLEQTTSAESEFETVLEITDATVSFDMDRGTSRVLNDATIDVRRDEILGVVGESGSGKSMFASSLLDAVVSPGRVSGEIRYHPTDGEPVDVLGLSDDELQRFRWEEIAMVFQGAMNSFNPTMTLRKHFLETLEAHDYPTDSGMERAHELLTDLHLGPERVLDSYPHELSGGMKQRALIALSLILDPEVIVMDEPTAALDLLMQRSILNLLEELQESHDLTVIFITHDLPLIAGLADRLAVMYAFEFAEVGPSEEVLEWPSHPYTRALLRAVPNLDTALSQMEPIEGSAPDPVNVPSGCSYHPRCPLADDRCRSDDPALVETGPDHRAACFHWEAAMEEIPLETDDSGTERAPEPVDPATGERVLSLEDVSVEFEKSDGRLLSLFSEPETVHAVDHVDLDVYENDVVALVGESGCGKTTLGKAAIAAQRPTGGSVNYRGQDIWDAKDISDDVEIPYDDIRQSLQMIHQDPGASLNPNQTVENALVRPLRHWRPDLDGQERRARVLTLLEHVGMTPPEDYAKRYPHQLSGGEKQRIALGRVLLMNPDVVLADEAVSALDVSLRVEMMDLMHDLQDAFGMSFLFISHNLSNARYLAGNAGGRIGVMYLGEIVEIAPAEELIQNPQHPYTQVLKWSTADLDSAESSGDPPIREIDVPDPTNPPSGCRFHTRCPEAREVCRRETPELTGDGQAHETACFRTCGDDHPYWESDSITDGTDANDGGKPVERSSDD